MTAFKVNQSQARLCVQILDPSHAVGVTLVGYTPYQVLFALY